MAAGESRPRTHGAVRSLEGVHVGGDAAGEELGRIGQFAVGQGHVP